MSDTVVENCEYEKQRNTKLCIRCDTEFLFRANKKFCSANCRRRHGEVTQNSLMCREKRRRNLEFFDRASCIAEQYFRLIPQDRDDYMLRLIWIARSGEDKSLRDVLTNKLLLDPSNNLGNHLRGNRGRSYGSIAQAAQAYCRKFWNASVKDVVYGRASEPNII